MLYEGLPCTGIKIVQEVIWVQDESASVQVYVLNPCLVPIPRQMDQYLILTAACDHLVVGSDGGLASGRASQPFVAKSFQVQVPAGLNLQHRSVADFASKGCTTLKLRPRESGVARLKVCLAAVHYGLCHVMCISYGCFQRLIKLSNHLIPLLACLSHCKLQIFIECLVHVQLMSPKDL